MLHRLSPFPFLIPLNAAEICAGKDVQCVCVCERRMDLTVHSIPVTIIRLKLNPGDALLMFTHMSNVIWQLVKQTPQQRH